MEIGLIHRSELITTPQLLNITNACNQGLRDLAHHWHQLPPRVMSFSMMRSTVRAYLYLDDGEEATTPRERQDVSARRINIKSLVEIGLPLYGSETSTHTSIATVIFRELARLFIDPDATGWWRIATGQIAAEPCDLKLGTKKSYIVDGTRVVLCDWIKPNELEQLADAKLSGWGSSIFRTKDGLKGLMVHGEMPDWYHQLRLEDPVLHKLCDLDDGMPPLEIRVQDDEFNGTDLEVAVNKVEDGTVPTSAKQGSVSLLAAVTQASASFRKSASVSKFERIGYADGTKFGDHPEVRPASIVKAVTVHSPSPLKPEDFKDELESIETEPVNYDKIQADLSRQLDELLKSESLNKPKDPPVHPLRVSTSDSHLVSPSTRLGFEEKSGRGTGNGNRSTKGEVKSVSTSAVQGSVLLKKILEFLELAQQQAVPGQPGALAGMELGRLQIEVVLKWK